MSSTPSTTTQADILLVTATTMETNAVLDLFEAEIGAPAQTKPIDDSIYYDLGTVAQASIYLVQSEMGSIGLGASQQTVQEGINTLKPTSVMMVGIAFGFEPDKHAIGDVLVSKQIFLYEPARLGTNIEATNTLEIISRGDLVTASQRLLNRCRVTETAWMRSRRSQQTPAVHIGIICSGEKLVDNVEVREYLRTQMREAIGGEMEGAGLYVTATKGKVDWILVKAICDWADGNKRQNKQQNQEQAATNAARFVLDTIKLGGLAQPHDARQEKTGSDTVKIINHASNQGAQGEFHGPITINNDNRRS